MVASIIEASQYGRLAGDAKQTGCRLQVMMMRRPLSSEYGTHKTVKISFRPWLSCKSPSNVSRCSPFARKRWGSTSIGAEKSKWRVPSSEKQVARAIK